MDDAAYRRLYQQLNHRFWYVESIPELRGTPRQREYAANIRSWFLGFLCDEITIASERYTPDDFAQRLDRLEVYLRFSQQIDSATFWIERAFDSRVWWMVQEIARAGKARQQT